MTFSEIVKATGKAFRIEKSISGYYRLMLGDEPYFDDSACEDVNENQETAESFFGQLLLEEEVPDAKKEIKSGVLRLKKDVMNEQNRLRIGFIIKELREKKGYTLRQLEELSGVSVQNLTKVEHGRYNVSIDILGRIAAALGATIKIE